MDRGRVGEDRESKETDGCPLTLLLLFWNQYRAFILLYKCPMRPYTLNIYKGREKGYQNTRAD
jgi:hypothetical protein